MTKKALVVLSGGQDSTTCLVMAVAQHGAENVAAVTFNYGQRHAIELQAARDVCFLLGVTEHEVADIGPILKSTSPLTDAGAPLETYTDFESMDKIIGDRVEKTFVPMRNALFLTLAANRAVCLGAKQIWAGVCQADNANYPDCRLDFINAQERAINEALGTAPVGGFRIGGEELFVVTPLLLMTKAQSIHELSSLGKLMVLAFTHTAYDGTYPPTSMDHASVLRAQGFVEAGLPDPLVLRARSEGLMELPASVNYSNGELNDAYITEITFNKGTLANREPQSVLGFTKDRAS